MDITYIGENLLPGQIGELLIIIAFVAALFSAFSYFNAARKDKLPEMAKPWLRLGRIAFLIQVIAVLGTFGTLFYIIYNHLFEYHYAWKHSSRGLKAKYLLSCFWEGSEGSFLLWIVWHALLGLILFKTGKQWESRVMTIVALVQAFLCTMLLGLYISPDIQIGSNPFSLLREEMDAPIFARPDYLQFITDGNGLNPLLQNYWMVIHPPVLFLGFSLTLFPFAYALAALWKGEYKSWIKPTLRWALMAAGLFGLGIMMGGAWAYESLTFGGYWAWDPVENASLVPWLIIIAGLHTLIIYKSTGRSLKITLVFFILTYLLIWYSTFLTRTGILGDTSVHSFTGEGKALYWHLLIVIGSLLGTSLALLIGKWKKMPRVAGEEELNTREFWMLIGSVLLLVAGLQIIFYTSLPVWAPLYNAISGTEIAPSEDPITFYNNIQVWFAIFIAILSAAIQFLKYKRTKMDAVWKRLLSFAGISLLLTFLLVYVQEIKHVQIWVFGFSIIFTLIANTWYIFVNQKSKLMKSGGAITHFGFGLMLLGILFSGYKKTVLSVDKTSRVLDFGRETFEENFKESRENMLLFRNTPMNMGDYMVTYLGDSTVQNDPPITYFKIRYDRRDPETNDLKETFYLYPDAFVNPKGQEGLSSNPDSRHYLTRDVFTYVTAISDPGKPETDTSSFQPVTVEKGDSIFIANGYLVFENIYNEARNPNYQAEAGDLPVEAVLQVYTLDGPVDTLRPLYIINGSRVQHEADTLRDLGLTVIVNKILPEDGRVEFGVKQRAQQDDWIVLKVLRFPWVNLLWAGLIIMTLGFLVSFWYRRK